MIPNLIEEPNWLFPFEGMEVGDSFFVPTLRFADMIYAIDTGAKRAGIRTKVYVTTKDDHIGVRVWRMS